MASMNDEALEIIWKEGGKAHAHRVAGLMKISADYARTILYSLGERDYIDIGPSDIAVITDKGKKAIERSGFFRKIEEEKRKEKKAEEETKKAETQRRIFRY
ncbi:MAG: hypothetical protein KKF30_19245 [Proteobacteria bacterium]|nr:hypothetical protein [Pseudomonadota bacterium]